MPDPWNTHGAAFNSTADPWASTRSPRETNGPATLKPWEDLE